MGSPLSKPIGQEAEAEGQTSQGETGPGKWHKLWYTLILNDVVKV